MAIGYTRAARGTDNINSNSIAVRFVDDELENMSPKVVPLQKLIGYGKPVTNPKAEWYFDELAPQSGTLNADVTTSPAAGTSEAWTVTDSSVFKPGYVLRINNTDNTGAVATPPVYEAVWVTAINSATAIQVTRGAGGTIGTHYVALSNTTLDIITDANKENIDTPLKPTTIPDNDFNYCQIFDQAIQMSYRQRQAMLYGITTGEGGDWALQIQKAVSEQMIRLEKALIRGYRQAASANFPGMLGGICETSTFINSANKQNGAGTAYITEAMFENIVGSCFDQVGPDNTKSMVVLTSRFQKQKINQFIRKSNAGQTTGYVTNDSINYGRAERTAGVVVDRYEWDNGTIDILMHYWMPKDVVVFLSTDYCKIRPFKGGQWQVHDLASSGAYDKMHLYGDYTFVMKNSKAHGIAYNLKTS